VNPDYIHFTIPDLEPGMVGAFSGWVILESKRVPYLLTRNKKRYPMWQVTVRKESGDIEKLRFAEHDTMVIRSKDGEPIMAEV
jgi:hypothetical protein